MHPLAPIENTFKLQLSPAVTTDGKDESINERYSRGEGRILIETNRERLQVFIEAIKLPGYLEMSPFYQRRERWDVVRQSLLIESFIMNIPVPPVFLYEKAFNKFEVMDGQQRITAIRDFYNNEFELEGLEYWPELNGRRYENLPEVIRAGIDRRSLSSIVLLRESAGNEGEVSLIRRVVFDRLNRGGIKLERQEIRNALWPSEFNELTKQLAENHKFAKAWKLLNQDGSINKNTFYCKMSDVEVVLRFFALRHADQLEGALQDFLDDYLYSMKNATTDDLNILHSLFEDVMGIGDSIFGDTLFKPWDPIKQEWASNPNKGFCDCVMTGISYNIQRAGHLIANKDHVIEATKTLFETHENGTFTGRKSTKKDLINRLKYFRDMLAGI